VLWLKALYKRRKEKAQQQAEEEHDDVEHSPLVKSIQIHSENPSNSGKQAVLLASLGIHYYSLI